MNNTYHFTLTAQHGNMFTFTQWTQGHCPVALVRGFGATEAEALEDAKSDLSQHADHAAPAPRSAQARSF